MYAELFEQLGLSPNEAKIYETLLESGESSVSVISLRAKIHRRNVYDALNRLVEKGVVFRIFQKGENRFKPVTPNKLLEILQEKKNKLDAALPELRRIYETDLKGEAAYIYKGLEGFKNYMRDVVRVAEDSYYLGAKALWFTPGIDKSFLKDVQRVAKEKNLSYYTLFDPRVKKEMPNAAKDVGGHYKFLPDDFPTPGVVDMFGDHVVTFNSADVGNFGEDGLIFVMINKELAESYKIWFRLIWDLLPGAKMPKPK